MFFITFEGPEGSGKSSVLEEIKKRLENDNVDFLVTREPGGSNISEQIREVILNKKNKKMDSWTEVLLYIAARRQHLVETVFAKENANKIIICDRFSDSTLAYQGYGRKLDIEKINNIQNLVFNNFQPDLTILFDVKPEIGLQRIKKRSVEQFNRLDEENLKFHQSVYEGYLKIKEQNMKRFKTVDASKNFISVVEEVYQIIKKQI